MDPPSYYFLLLAVVLSLLTVVAAEEWKEKITVDHSYYKMHLYKTNAHAMYDKHYVDMSESIVHEFLSNHSQAAEAVAPGFEFPFYGHMVDRFYITTHGFLSFAPRLHNLMYKTQYIAPLRVKLDPSLSSVSTIKYLSTADQLTIQWTNVTVAKPYAHPQGGNFTFQVTLYKNGDITFVYVDIPALLTSDALYDGEPVAGLSDAFLIGDSELHVYHTLNVDNPDIMTQTVVLFEAKPTCIQQTSCEACSALRDQSDFKCTWCAKVHRCSDGADRLREHWDSNLCPQNNMTTLDHCAAGAAEEHHTEWRSSSSSMVEVEQEDSRIIDTTTKKNTGRRRLDDSNNNNNNNNNNTSVQQQSSASADVGTIISTIVSVILVLILMGIFAAFLFLYGRSNPGGIAERIAMRMEANYKRFGGESLDSDSGNNNSSSSSSSRRDVEMDESDDKELQKQSANNNNNNNNSSSSSSSSSITMPF